MKKEIQLNVMEELQSRLNGYCSDDIITCPNYIANHYLYPNLMPDTIWNCKDCIKMFKGIIDLNKCLNTAIRPCPCSIAMTGLFNLTSQDVLTRLDEYIEELKEELYG